jgi:VWFA-related protein
MSASEGAVSRNRQSAAVLKGFAEKSGGLFVATPGGPALRDAFAGIADELGHQYTIAYRPANRQHDGKWRKLDVRISRNDLQVRTRKGYRAPKN